jgi:hypothetical protein
MISCVSNVKEGRLRMKPVSIAVASYVRAFRRFQYSAVAGLLLLCLAMYLFTAATGHRRLLGLSVILDVGAEQSLPTYFSTLNLLLSSGLLWLIYRLGIVAPALRRYWLILSLIFLVLSADEAISLHEKLTYLRRYTGGIDALATHGWVIYGFPLVLALGLYFVPFLLRLPSHLRWRIVAAGAVFVTGALGFETLAGLMLHAKIASMDSLLYKMRRLAEEGCEMYGIALFNCVLFAEIGRSRAALFIGVERAPAAVALKAVAPTSAIAPPRESAVSVARGASPAAGF